jgi:magnesium chelatase subunit D
VNRANADIDLPLMRGLACAALNPDLRSILVFDATIATLQAAANNLALMLERVTSDRVVSVQIGVIETEEDLWGSLALSEGNADRSFEWRRGILASGRDRELRLVVIPDLTRLSLAGARACVTSIGSDIAYLERHGHRDAWQPNLCWLAGCSRSDVGLVSPHLLDRFALRLGSQDLVATDRVSALQRWLKEPQESPKSENRDLSAEWIKDLKQAKSSQPEVTLAAQQRVLDYFVLGNGYSVRRELALLRLAQASAQIDGIDRVTVQQVDLAARAIGLKAIESAPLAPENPIQTELDRPSLANIFFKWLLRSGLNSLIQYIISKIGHSQIEPSLEPSSTDRKEMDETQFERDIQDFVYDSDTTETLPSQSIGIDGEIAYPYPEDTMLIQREAASLRLPLRRFKNAVLGRGTIVGVEPTKTPQDLAIVSTIVEAAKYQQIRQLTLLNRQDNSDDLVDIRVKSNLNREQSLILQIRRSTLLNRQDNSDDLVDIRVKPNPNGEQSLILQPSDLRRYRRAVMPEQMLALVLDRTCLKDCKWQESLLPYWQWAYEERASVCLIQVGAANPRNELQAEKITADKILVPRIRLSLNAKPGRSTPLAHGLDLGLQTLRHALQHGRSAIQQAVLVVISDGRGNVPLEASRTGLVTSPVGRQGIEDALVVARQIAGLKEVKSVVLNPQPKHYRDLPVKLAQALGSKIAEIPPLNVWEVEE